MKQVLVLLFATILSLSASAEGLIAAKTDGAYFTGLADEICSSNTSGVLHTAVKYKNKKFMTDGCWVRAESGEVVIFWPQYKRIEVIKASELETHNQ